MFPTNYPCVELQTRYEFAERTDRKGIDETCRDRSLPAQPFRCQQGWPLT